MRGDWSRKRGSVKWHQRQREIPVRTQSWTDTSDGFIHAPLGLTTAQPASDPVPTDTLHANTQPIPQKRHLTTYHIQSICALTRYDKLDASSFPNRSSWSGWEVKLVPQQKLNYFHCLMALRGKTAFEGWRSNLWWGKGGPKCLITWLPHFYTHCGKKIYEFWGCTI